MNVQPFDDHESEVRSYCRSWPAVFTTAKGTRLWDENGRCYLDFFSGAGALNYGHNPPELKAALLEYLAEDNIVHGLDMMTVAKRTFLERFAEVILEPRGLDYKVQFPGPTGTNAVESALKLARKVTGRETVVSFTNAFHGMTLGSLSVTGNAMKRGGAGVPLVHSARMPYCDYLDEGPSLDVLEMFLADSGSGLDLPAAVIVETVQGEGGLNVASDTWLQRLKSICAEHDVLLIVDDVQMAIGRTGPFFSFEPSGITPDIVCLSKSISGFGLPMALTLLRPELDIWGPGEHNGTFRGNNPAFVTATAALSFWTDDKLSTQIAERADTMGAALGGIADRHRQSGAVVKGKGLARGIGFTDPAVASAVAAAAFDAGMLVETSGAESEVVKLMPPVNVTPDDLIEGLDLLGELVDSVIGDDVAAGVGERG
ncbi:MAG: diaminobutyrate--2-oxoglutarate transaminase [Acidimicrobiia bacterium]|nr:diaminobutyrate--2-oxoglutarate transaminase [Acidimicrobiia bacterium]